MIVVRFADDIVLGFQYKSDAERFREELVQRLRKFRLELHPDKTRLVEFGCYAAVNRQRRGQGKPETFAFLGFTHICGKTRSGRFTVLRQTIRQRLQAKLGEVKTELQRRMHQPIPELGKWLGAVVRGHMQDYGALPFLVDRRDRQAQGLRMRSQIELHVRFHARVQLMLAVIEIDFSQHRARRQMERVRVTRHRTADA
jgi:Reverse transcriptase (RNA-dependent DNA polymerase)